MDNEAIEKQLNKIEEDVNISLTKYIDQRICDLKAYHDKDIKALSDYRMEATQSLREFLIHQLQNIKEQTNDRSVSMEKRLEGMNEIRNAMKDQASRLLDRKEFESYKEAADKDIRMLRESKAELGGKADQSSVTRIFVVSIIGTVISVIMLLVHILGVI